MNKFISSTKNSLIRDILQLQEKSRKRKKEGRFVIEGLREFGLASESGYEMEHILICEEIINKSDIRQNYPQHSTADWIGISVEVYQKLSHRKSTEGIIAIAKSKSHDLADIEISDNPLILVAEAPEKPGNIGALLRTADAANIDLVIIANPKTDLYNPNIIRSSVGCIFTNKLATGNTREIIDFLKKRQIKILSAALSEKSVNYTQIDMTEPVAIVVGTEDKGLSDAWLQQSDHQIIIPMEGKIDSLNVSVSAAILIFEAKRQRKVAAKTK